MIMALAMHLTDKQLITPSNLIKHELIGLFVEVTGCTSKCCIGIKGTVADETKNLLVMETEKGEKKIPKKNSIFLFTLPDKTKLKVNGSLLAMRPEERISKKLKKW